MLLTGGAYLVADQRKFARRTPFRIPNFKSAAGVIVDKLPDKALQAAWHGRGIKVIAA